MALVAVVQARYSSQRLPGKVLREVDGKPLLGFLLERLHRCKHLSQTIVATSTDASDDAIARFCTDKAVPLYRGPLDDVLARFVGVAGQLGESALVRISGDSPLMDPEVVDRAVVLYEEGDADLVTNVQIRSFPKGQSVEVIARAALQRAAEETSDSQDREHVTRYFYRHPERFRIRNFKRDPDAADIQLSVDSAEDFEMFARLIAAMRRPPAEYGLNEILALRESCVRS
jgi:spore coat polysaccharide biosynthesis protein SpsF